MVFIVVSPLASVAHQMSSQSRRALPADACELTLELLSDAYAPGPGNGLRRRVRKNLLFASRQPIEDLRGGRFRRRLRYLETAVHVGVDRTENHPVYRNAFAREQRSQ